MLFFKKFVISATCVIAMFIIHLTTSYSQTVLLEQTLTSDILIEDEYLPGSGLPVGKIQSVWGEALVFHRDPTVGYRVQAGLPLYSGDIIRTPAAAWVQCRLIDGSQIALAPDTTLTVRQSNCISARKTCASIIYLKYGAARFKLKRLADLKTFEFKVQTDLASASAEDAEFIVNAIIGATGFIALEKSRMEIATLSQPDEVTYISDFQKTTLSNKVISPTVETLSGGELELILAKFYPELPSSWFADGSEGDQVFESSETELPSE